MKIINVYKDFNQYGGAEQVALTLHRLFKERKFDAILSGGGDFSNIYPVFGVSEGEYFKLTLKALFSFKGCVVISHHRRFTTLIYIVNKLFKLKIRLIHVSHNEFHDLKYFTFYPDEVVAVSGRVKSNLLSFFGLSPDQVRVIYNGLADRYCSNLATKFENKNENILILYPGRITEVKRQVEVISRLKNKIKANIEIHFAGEGEDLETLRKITKGSQNFKCLGFVSVIEILPKYDYVMLFSTNEGLPLSLIEACMFGKPIICSDVGGNSEIVSSNENGFITNEFDELIEILNALPLPDSPQYRTLASTARRTYESKFQKSRMVTEYLQLIHQ